MDLKLTPEMQSIMTAAKQAVAEFNHEYVGTEHILMGMARSPTMKSIFEHLGTTGEEIQQRINRFMEIGPEKLDIPDPQLSPRADLALQKAIQRAKKDGRAEVSEMDVLLEISSDVECIASQILLDLGINPEDTVNALEHA
jgi:ATP-dependent Clp protease ATP-binding subunit ClpC